LLEMAALDEQALTRAFQAFLKRDRQLAYSVILHDQDVDASETELDQLCMEFIVRHQPAAAHLRFVYSASKIINELERVGDYAESIARQVLLINSLPFELPTDKFSEIANLAIPMLHNAVQAFVDKNPDLARTTMASEPRVNEIRDSISADLVGLRQQGRLPLEALPPLITVARRFERVSDQASRSIDQVPQLDYVQVIVALGKDPEKAFPKKPTKTLCLHWNVPDPSQARGTPEEVRAAYERAFESMTNHIRDLVQAILGEDKNQTNEPANPSI